MPNKIKQIFNITSKQFMSGISPSAHLDQNGLFFKALGINPFINPFPNSVDVGLLQVSGNPTDITGGVVVDSILAGTTKITASAVGNLYMVGSGGNFYNKDLSNENAPTNLRSGGSTITTPANGLEIFRPNTTAANTEFLYYWQTTQIGRWDLTSSHPSGWVDNQFTGLESTTYHPTHFFQGDVYYGNKSFIGKIYSNEGVATNNLIALDFPADFITTCLSDDGTYLIAGISKDLGSLTLQGTTKVVFWDTISLSPTKEWVIPDFGINALKRFGNGHLAFCGRGLWYFSFDTKPTKIRTLGTSNSIAYGYPNAVDILNDAALWGGDALVASFGKFAPEASNAYLEPIKLPSGTVIFVNSSARVNRVYIGTTEPKFYTHTLSDGGGTTTTFPETVYLDLGDEVNITRMDILLGEPLATGDRFTLRTQTDEDNSASDYGSLSFDTDGAKRKIKLFKELKANQLKLLFNFETGNVKIKAIKGYGYSNPY